MNDRFKFRAWHKQDKRMLEVIDIQLSNKSIYGRHHDYVYWTYEYEFDEIELMQSTGLKDKNGMLIYEGDIIINRRSPNSLASEYKWIVEFGEHATSSDYYASRAYGFYARQIGFDDEASLVQIYDEIEIIGNIFKDAHLLEKT